MAETPFSGKYGYAPQLSNLIYEDAPEQVRVGLREVLGKCGYDSPSQQRDIICEALRKRLNPRNWSEYPNIDGEVDRLIHGCEWYTFYDMCERIYSKLTPSAEIGRLKQNIRDLMLNPTHTSFDKELNQLMKEEGIGYVMLDGRITKVGSEEFDQAPREAAEELDDSRSSVPLQQFKKALDFRNGMPPDYANVVKEAVNAVEGVWQILTNMPGTALPTLLSSIEPPLPSGLKKLYDGLYGYGSGSEGARHAGIGGDVPEAEDAEFIIHSAAASIRYAIKTYG